jgi:hypothetical protein
MIVFRHDRGQRKAAATPPTSSLAQKRAFRLAARAGVPRYGIAVKTERNLYKRNDMALQSCRRRRDVPCAAIVRSQTQPP